MAENNGNQKEEPGASQQAKTTKKKKVGYYSRWKKTSLGSKVLIGIGFLALIPATSYTIYFIRSFYTGERHYAEEHKPLVVLSRPPRFLQPIICDPRGSGGGFTSGNMEIFAKNIGNETAYRVLPLTLMVKIIPEHRTGNVFRDEPPNVNEACDISPSIPPLESSLHPGEEKEWHIRSSAGTLPPLNEGDPVQLYSANCVYYYDGNGRHHASCIVYQFSVPSDNPLYHIWGTPTFLCDGKPKFGTFSPSLNSGCEK